MHIVEIANRTGVDENKLGRILRLLASTHIFREGKFFMPSHCSPFDNHYTFPVKRDVFANNRLSIQLISTNPLSNIGFYLLV